ncbi:carbon monoxide dehydrogenase [Rhodobacteraceae bacterium 2CG4]|uniref:Carbon monoxide dehydrogenase n=1 Tax=Halovulum marinum TaxID=2662447 RepID=A0A6L5Z0U4_9RHOB|nr:carbon monoxide dehydrogenase subunit G [Halovulum marinum]MSU90161.1 carbon monoxide dehydrogenase [Halovulum marinum]
MELHDEIRIEAPREQVYAALNDTEVLKASIPGCEELVRTSEDELEAKVTLKVGPVKARFKGNVTLDRSGAPERFALSGQGSGGAAGFAKGGADVVLEEIGPSETLLRYDARADVGGKLAQLGNRLISGTAKKLSAQFFDNFARQVGAEVHQDDA